jgi:peptide methionine sulfoxide reductase MsrB
VRNATKFFEKRTEYPHTGTYNLHFEKAMLWCLWRHYLKVIQNLMLIVVGRHLMNPYQVKFYISDVCRNETYRNFCGDMGHVFDDGLQKQDKGTV